MWHQSSPVDTPIRAMHSRDPRQEIIRAKDQRTHDNLLRPTQRQLSRQGHHPTNKSMHAHDLCFDLSWCDFHAVLMYFRLCVSLNAQISYRIANYVKIYEFTSNLINCVSKFIYTLFFLQVVALSGGARPGQNWNMFYIFCTFESSIMIMHGFCSWISKSTLNYSKSHLLICACAFICKWWI